MRTAFWMASSKVFPMAITSPTAIAAGSYQRDREAKVKATLRTWRHAAAQLGGHLAELGQVPARNLDHAAIQRRLEAGRRGLVDAVADGWRPGPCPGTATHTDTHSSIH